MAQVKGTAVILASSWYLMPLFLHFTQEVERQLAAQFVGDWD